jgi:hypothetical protein
MAAPKIRLADSVNVVECDEGHCHVEFLDGKGNVFAEAVLDMDYALDIGLDILEIADDGEEDGAPIGATVQ